MPNYGISENEVAETRKHLGCSGKDAFVIVAGPKEKAAKAIRAVAERAFACLEGVPEETRGAVDEGNTEYLRPLPGAARMYPETDLESIPIQEKTLVKIRGGLPLGITEREKLYRKWGLNEKHVNEMKLSNFARMFERKVNEGLDAKRLAVFLLEGLVEARGKGAKTENLSKKYMEEFLEAMHKGAIVKEIQVEALVEKSLHPEKSLEEIVKGTGRGVASQGEAEKIVGEIVAKNKKLIQEQGERAIAPLMGDAMKQLKGKLSGKEISELLKKEIGKTGAGK